jgi:outer membrane receptor protein involved in Fe transport
MNRSKGALFGATAVIAVIAMQSRPAEAQSAAAAAPSGGTSVAEVIVTANKRQENIQNVGMSIQAATGDKLTKMGITDTASLQKIVPGFLFTPTYSGTVVYTIRGVGFQDTSLAGSPTVSVYLDEAPLPFSALAQGATLDLQRVEVLKGPQGTLFGNNATGGAINYIANKPTDTFQAGGDLSYGNFSDTNVQGFVSGPIADGLDARLALQSHTSGAWQKGYGPQSGQSTGGADFLNGRFSLQWKPNDNFKALLTLNGWQDKSYNQVGQLFGIARESPTNPLAPAVANYPLAPHNDQAAGWNECVNTSPYNPIAGQSTGTTYLTANGTPESEGVGSAVQAGGQPTSCMPLRRNNTYYDGTLRMDYDLGHDMTVTSLTEYQKFNRLAGIDASGMPYQDYQAVQSGKIMSINQELRLAGKFDGKGSWIVGANYEYDNTWDTFFQSYGASTAVPGQLPFAVICLGPLGAGCTPAETPGNPAYDPTKYPAFQVFTGGPTRSVDTQVTSTYAVFAHAEYPILDNLTLLGGVRFTQENKTGQTCGVDGGDGTWGAVAQGISNLLEVSNGTISPNAFLNNGGLGVNVGPNGCGTTGPGPGYLSFGTVPTRVLDQNNIAWQTGLDWKVTPNNLLYVNISQGYKGGSFPTVALSAFNQLAPVVQEGLLSYEGGFKSTLFDHQLTLNGAGFYYDYINKQILGAIKDPFFGALPELVNVPHSHVIGFELSGAYTPEWLKGLTITPAVSYQSSRVDGCTAAESVNCIGGQFHTFDDFSHYANVNGQPFPSAPEWQASVDAEYDWKLRDDVTAFVGVNVNYISGTHTFFTNPTPGSDTGGPSTEAQYNPLVVPAYTLVDLRAGISKDAWRVQVWGRNVTNAYYWTAANHVNDVLIHYTGMPTTYGFTLSYRYR